MRRSPSLFGRFILSLRVDGLGPTLRRVSVYLFGTEDRYVFVQHLNARAEPFELPVEMNGLLIRHMTDRDLEDLRFKRYEPADLGHLTEAITATRDGQIVGVGRWTDAVGPHQPWYRAVEPHLIPPSWFDVNLFVLPGERAAAWAISKCALDRLAAAGVLSVVSLAGVDNKPSILLLHLLGSKIVARMSTRRRFGYTTTVIDPIRPHR